MKIIRGRIWNACFEGEEAEAEAKAEAGPDKIEVKAGATFTQAEVNKIIENRLARDQASRQALASELTALRAMIDISGEEQQNFDAKLVALRQESMTKEELAKEQQQALRAAHKKEAEDLIKDRDGWRNRYNTTLCQREISDACSIEGQVAFNPAQVSAILGADTVVEEVLDEAGKGTNTFSPVVTYTSIDKEGKPVVLKLSVADAVKRMSTDSRYLNLFRGEGRGGLGDMVRHTGPAGAPVTAGAVAKESTEEYIRQRKAGELKLE